MLTALKVPIHPFRHHRTVTVSLEPGRCLWLQGPNGSGKTTVLRALGGQFFVPGLVLPQDVIFIASKPLVIRGLSVREQILYYQKVYQTNYQSSAWVQGIEDYPVWTLSQGQSQRLSLLRLGFSQNKLWLLDEPYNALDKEGIGLFNDMIDHHLFEGGAVVYSSHVKMRQGCRELCIGS
tara:strand:- start:642 stop:1178 length:537 start_codon:yes stop_codon:yes gene_type:complete